MDANILLGLGLYTIIGVAPLVYNYYVVNKKHANKKTTENTNRLANVSRVPVPPRPVDNRAAPSQRYPMGLGGALRARTPPIIVLVLNNKNLEDPEIRRLVITYLMRDNERREATVVEQDKPLELGVRGVAPPTEIHATSIDSALAVEA